MPFSCVNLSEKSNSKLIKHGKYEDLTLINNILNNFRRNQNHPFPLDLLHDGGIGGNRGILQIGNLPDCNRNIRRVQGGFLRGSSNTGNERLVAAYVNTMPLIVLFASAMNYKLYCG